MSPKFRAAAALLPLLLALAAAGCGETNAASIHPSIRVETNAGNVLDGLSFGEVPIGGFADETFVIRSAEQVPLDVRAIDFEAEDGSSAAAFSLQSPIPLVVGPLQSTQVRVRFAPDEVRRYQATAVVRSNDPDRPAVRIPLVGDGVAGRLEVIACLPNTPENQRRCADTKVSPPDVLDLGEVTAGDHAAALVTLQNGGGDALQVHKVAFVDPAGAAAAGFSLPANAEAGMTIPALTAGDFRVEFNPPAGTEGPAGAVVRIESDSITSPVVDVEITATVVPNTAPVACVYVREIRRIDGTNELFAPGDVLPVVEPSDVVVFDARAGDGCSGDAEDGENVTVEWTLTSPTSASRLGTVSGEPLVRTLEADATGDYRVDVLVRDSLGLEATTDAAGRPATVTIHVAPRRDIAVEIAWNAQTVDVDLHFVRGTADAIWSDDNDLYWDNLDPDWGVVGDPFDDPLLLIDDLGYGPLVETAVLNRPEAGQSYWVYARLHKDERQRSAAPNCSEARDCAAGLVCSGATEARPGKCMAPVDVGLKVFLRSSEFDLSVLPGFDNPARLASPCDTWLAGRVIWPADGSGTPTFEMIDQVFADGTPNGGLCE